MSIMPTSSGIQIPPELLKMLAGIMRQGGVSQTGSPQSSLGQTPLGQNNFGPSASLASMAAPGPQGGANQNNEMMAMLKKLMNQQTGNGFYNPYMKGPDWGTGISNMITNAKSKMSGGGSGGGSGSGGDLSSILPMLLGLL